MGHTEPGLGFIPPPALCSGHPRRVSQGTDEDLHISDGIPRAGMPWGAEAGVGHLGSFQGGISPLGGAGMAGFDVAVPPASDHWLSLSLPSEGLFCNRTFDMYACWPDGSPGTAVNVSCPFYLPWFEKGEDALLPPWSWKPGLSRAGVGEALRVPLLPADRGRGTHEQTWGKGTQSRPSLCSAHACPGTGSLGLSRVRSIIAGEGFGAA